MSITQTMSLMYKSEVNLQCKIRDGYLNDPKTQRFLHELRKGKVLQEVKLVDGLLKYK